MNHYGGTTTLDLQCPIFFSWNVPLGFGALQRCYGVAQELGKRSAENNSCVLNSGLVWVPPSTSAFLSRQHVTQCPQGPSTPGQHGPKYLLGFAPRCFKTKMVGNPLHLRLLEQTPCHTIATKSKHSRPIWAQIPLGFGPRFFKTKICKTTGS